MITSCILLIASFGQGDTQLSTTNLNEITGCLDNIPTNMVQHLPEYIEHFDEENLYTALRIGWCESRGKSSAYRKSADDSGVMQFIPSTWDWVAAKHNMPKWDEWIILRYGQPYFGSLLDINEEGLSARRVQFVPYYNIQMASLLAEDTYSKLTWKDWNASKFCWGNAKKWEKKWRSEEYLYNY